MPSTLSRNSQFDLFRLLLLAALLLYSIVFTQLAFDQHAGMRTHRSDLGQIDQSVWNSSRGRFLENTDAGFIATRLTDHVEPILVLISPLFWLWNDVRALLLLQVLMVAIGAWPLYELTLLRLDRLLTPRERTLIWQIEPLRQMTRPLALTLAVAYLLAPQLQSAVLTEFHAAPLAVSLTLWAFWAIERRHTGQFVIATLLVASVKEETALLAAGLGVWGLWQGARGEGQGASAHPFSLSSPLPVSLSVIALSLAWFYLATFVIVPAHAAELYGVAESGYFARYGALGDSPLDIFKSFFTQPALVWQIATEPARLDYLWGLLATFGFFSLLAPEIVLLSLPVLLANLLSAYPAQYYGEFHYSAPLVPYFAVSAAYGLGRLWRWLGRRASSSSPGFQHMAAAGTGTMALVALLRNTRTTVRPLLVIFLGIWIIGWAIAAYASAGRGPLGGRYDPTPITEHHRLLPRFTGQIPVDAPLTATAAVHPHVSHRRYIYQFPLGLDSPIPAQWALLDVTTNTDMAPGDVKALVDEMLAGNWGVVDAADGFLLLQRGATTKTIPDTFFDFVRASPGEQEQFSARDAANPLTFLGASFEDWPRWRQTQISFFWQVGHDFSAQIVSPQIELVTPDGSSFYSLATVTPPALLWLPPNRWQAGEVIKLTTPWLYLPPVWGILTDEARVVAAYQRTADHNLVALPLDPLDLGWIANRLANQPTDANAQFQPAQAEPVEVRAWLPTTAERGAGLNLWLQWKVPADWPAGWTTFVHLRQGEQTRTQADGDPRFFAPASPEQTDSGAKVIPDWRLLPVPTDAMVGETWQVVMGLYDPQTSRRADLLDATGNVIGNELVIGEVAIVAPPVPDQACALIPATCASQ